MNKLVLSLIILSVVMSLNLYSQTYTMPFEGKQHEGTWLQWPHSYTYGTAYRNSLDPTWVAMTSALVGSEKVHIIAYNNTEKNRITGLLNTASVPLTNIDFFIYQTDDVWVRDNGPIFVYDNSNNLKILDWDFNGWGLDTPYSNDNIIPQLISADIGIPRIDLSAMVLEGGAIEHDGKRTMIATKSSLKTDRNSGLNFTQIESYLTTNMGFNKFIWLDGLDGGNIDITDQHIDGFVRFADSNTIMTLSDSDLAYWEVSPSDIVILHNASDIDSNPYNVILVPLTQYDVSTTGGTNLGYKGSYINFYEGNTVVLVPNYNDPNDAVANEIIQGFFTGKTVIGIDCRNLYKNGGMVHCVTQQQPVGSSTGVVQNKNTTLFQIRNSPNPFNTFTCIEFHLAESCDVKISVYDIMGCKINTVDYKKMVPGVHEYLFDGSVLYSGVYFYNFIAGDYSETKRMLLVK